MPVEWFKHGRGAAKEDGAAKENGAGSEAVTPIPEPPGLPFVGNMNDIDRELPLRSFSALAEKYGEIYRLRLPGRTLVTASSHRLINELCDEKRFVKIPRGALHEVRNCVHDGLFTANPDEPNWGIAHRILMPALAMKIARHGSHTPIAATEDFTRLALDTLALCSMGFRFNSYYTNELHPFVSAMGDFLTESGRRPSRPMPNFFYRAEDAKYEADIEVLQRTASEVLQARKKNPNDKKDLMNAMLNGVDPKTGCKMSDQSIIDNLVTFLIAGHETTSGTLSFAFYELLKNPEAYRKVQQEVDEVVGKGPVKVEHLSKIPYTTAVIRETLRLDSPITLINVVSMEDTLLGGKYPIAKDEGVTMFIKQAHLDPEVFGLDAKEFKPERMLDEPFNNGNGARACIGRPFAMQEMLLTMIVLFQNFNFVYHDPSYRLALKQTLTIKPDGFQMRAILRDGLEPSQLEHRLAGKEMTQQSLKPEVPKVSTNGTSKAQPMTILYGSNSGTCEALAQRLAGDAASHGFEVDVIDAMDAGNGCLKRKQPVIIITASYEGEAPDNAAHFVSWIANAKGKEFDDVEYAVFGVGHHDWAQTFHRIPKLVDGKLSEMGGTRIAPIGLSDVASSDAFTDFETWEDGVLFPALKKQYGMDDSGSEATPSSGLNVTVTNPRKSALRQDVMEGLVVENRTLTAEGEPVKKHIEIALPSGETYRAGDYLAVLPMNPKETVQRVMRRFRLPWDAHMTIAGDGNTALPTDVSIPVQSILGAYVELSQPATKRNILTLSEVAKVESERDALKRAANEDFAETFNSRISILDLLEKYPSANLSLGAFLAMLPPMRVRQYSISSSPLWNPSHVTLTFSVLEAPSKSGQGVYLGVATSYLNSLAAGDVVHVSVRPSHAAFHLPQDPERTPVICVAAGSGLAPFRGFVQERAELLGAGRKIAPCVLFVGCRAPGRDDIYADELAAWEAAGAVTVHRAYSRAAEQADGHHRYVQDAVMAHRDEIDEFWRNDAKLYICGSRAVGEGVRQQAIRLKMLHAEEQGRPMAEEEARKWWESERNARYATDVFD
ncbi:cytochrome P450 [Xylariaceae sp. FL0804]|nr:cytochrome P450 [Xylariaceae sp. FL0804]